MNELEEWLAEEDECPACGEPTALGCVSWCPAVAKVKMENDDTDTPSGGE